MKSNRIFALLLAMLLALTSIGIAEEMLDTEFTFEIEGEEPAAPELPEEEIEEEEYVALNPKSVEADFEFSENEDGTRTLVRYIGVDADVVISKEWNVSVIGSEAFCDNEILKSITLPGTVKKIGDYAFANCRALKTVNLSEGLTHIQQAAFYGTDSLTSIKLPKSLKSFEEATFYRSGLSTINIPEGITQIPDEAFRASSIKSIALPKSVKRIGVYAFCDCYQLKTVTLSEGLTEISNGAFEWCTALKSIKLPKSLKTLENYSFSHSGLRSIVIPEGITQMAGSVFQGCYYLTSVTLPKTIKAIDYGAFSFCHSLKTLKLPHSLTYIGDYAFNSCYSLTTISIPDGVYQIGEYAFEYCQSLTSVKLPKGITAIQYRTFWSCAVLKSIVIPDSVTTIYDGAFERCASLTSITLPANVDSIGYNAFNAVDKDVKWVAFPGSYADQYGIENGFMTTYRKDYALAPVEKNIECMIDDTVDMSAFVSTPAEPVGASFVLKSSSAKVLTVDNAALTAKAIAEGSATLTATMTVVDPANAKKNLAKKTASVKVKVLNPKKLERVFIANADQCELTVGGTNTIEAQVVPDTAEDVTITYKSSNTKVATVSDDGMVTAVKKGSATITVTAVQGKVKKTASVKLTIKE